MSKPKIAMYRTAYEKISYWVDKCPKEISGLGVVENIDGILTVTDAYLLEQENTASTTDIEPDAVNSLLYKMIQDGHKGELKFWWHSHVNMDVFWSGTDKSTMKKLSEQGWYLHGVFNKKEETKFAFTDYSYKPTLAAKSFGITSNVFIDDLEVDIIENIKDPVLIELYKKLDNIEQQIGEIEDKAFEVNKELWDKDYAEKVKIKTYVYSGNTYHNKNNKGWSKWDDWDSWNSWDIWGVNGGYDKKDTNDKKNIHDKYAGKKYDPETNTWVPIDKERKPIGLVTSEMIKTETSEPKRDYTHKMNYCKQTTDYCRDLIDELVSQNRFSLDDWEMFYSEVVGNYVFDKIDMDDAEDIYFESCNI